MKNIRDLARMWKLMGRAVLPGLALALLGVASAWADVVFNPDALVLDQITPTGEMGIDYTGGGTAFVAGYSLDLTWDSALATVAFARPDSGPFAAAVTFFVVDLGAGHVRLDGAIGAEDPGFDAGPLCKLTVTAVDGTRGSTAIDLTILSLRDSLNQPVTGVTAQDAQVAVDTAGLVLGAVVITNDTLAHTDDFVKDTDAVTVTATVTDDDPGFGVANLSADLSALGLGADVAPDSYLAPTAVWTVPAAVCSPADGLLTVTVTATDADENTSQGGDTITADNTPPAALTGVSVLPGHQQIHLAWDDFAAADANPLGVEFRASAWGGYPAYDDPAPDYPADRTAGNLALQATAGTSADWAVTEPDIYYLAGFVYDMVLLDGPAGPASTGRATSYWLGDTNADGEVDVANDINRLGNTYGLPDTDGAFDAVCDVGPTDTGSPRGIPQPNDDHEIGFEDMMVFALNYTVVSPGGKALDTPSSGGVPPVLAWRPVADEVWALSLVEGGGDLRGLNLKADLPPGLTCTVQKGELTAAQPAPSFLRNVPGHGLDAGLALFGGDAGFTGAGELVRVTFSEPVADVRVGVTARDQGNADLAVQMSQVSPANLPTRASFAPNYPNPFNPRTTLAFALPEGRHVNLAVYGLNGTRIRTLVDARRAAGNHEVVWDGRDEAGRPVAAGAYFARIQAGDFRQIRKMVLVK